MDFLKIFDSEFYYLLYLRRVFGKKLKSIGLHDFRKNMKELSPTFILSTGRCGTKWVDELFKTDSKIVSIHHIHPVMRSQGKIAYERNYSKCNDSEKELIKEMFLAGREEVFLQAMKVEKNIVFTDSRMTFFAEVIFDLFPKAKFVHLHRHPGDVVRSGLNRGWYTLDSQSELNRIEPQEDSPYYNEWDEMSSVEKNAWLWSETNQWILDFFDKVPEDQKMELSFDRWSAEVIHEFCSFCNVDLSTSKIERRMSKKVNIQKHQKVGHYTTWSAEDRKKLKDITQEVSDKLSYSF